MLNRISGPSTGLWLLYILTITLSCTSLLHAAPAQPQTAAQTAADPALAELVLAQQGQSNYQIVLPDPTTTQALTASMQEIARMVQAAFKANGFDVPITTETSRDKDKPSIYLGDTVAARQAGIEAQKIKGWGYHLKVTGQDVLIVGRDNSPLSSDSGDIPKNAFERLGTAKGVVDFLRQYAGVRFLFPVLNNGNASPLSSMSKVDLLNTPAIEYLPVTRIALPKDLDQHYTPRMDSMFSHRGNTDFYHLTMNRFPLVDQLFRGHTWADAIPPAQYAKTHPEYFALLSGKRMSHFGRGVNAQYCISNPEVQELFYQDLAQHAKNGHTLVDLGQPDGFRQCQCDNCRTLFDTQDWGEKIWILHRNLAQRLYKVYPDVTVTIMSYILTAKPPATFDTFPPNVQVMITGVNKHETKAWQNFKVPRGFSGYAYFWTPNLVTRYLPMATPSDLERKMHDMLDMHVQSLYLDTSGGLLFGLGGPAYYTMGRVLDDPQNNNTLNMTNEYISAAYGKRAGQFMRNFYIELYESVEQYARYFSTREIAWTQDIGMRSPSKTIRDPFKLLGFLYTPDLMASMENNLATAEKTAESPKIQARLALVRREFDYLKSFAKVTHLYQAYQVVPKRALLETLLDALDERNALIHSYYDERGRTGTSVRIPGWPQDTVQTFPPPGHSAPHLLPAYNTYQTPYVNTFVNWDTQAMRASMEVQTSEATILHSDGVPTLDAAQWQLATPLDLKTSDDKPTQTQVRVLYDATHLHVHLTATLPEKADNAATPNAAVQLHLSPVSGSSTSYRFTLTPGSNRQGQAARGLITDAMDPRYGQYEPDWKADSKLITQTNEKTNQWTAMLSIPFASMNAQAPEKDTLWQANIVQMVPGEKGQTSQAMWSTQPGSKAADDARDFGKWTFSDVVAMNKIRQWRLNYNHQKNLTDPKDWASLDAKKKLSFGPWLFQADGLDQGMEQQWFVSDRFNAKQWQPIAVPSFWAENDNVGNVQGLGWYHTTFTLTPEEQGQTVRLWFSGVDEQAWVYINGKLAGEHTTAHGKSISDLWEAPFTIDLPTSLLQTGVNTMIVRVHNATANGGIWRPVHAGVIKK